MAFARLHMIGLNPTLKKSEEICLGIFTTVTAFVILEITVDRMLVHKFVRAFLIVNSSQRLRSAIVMHASFTSPAIRHSHGMKYIRFMRWTVKVYETPYNFLRIMDDYQNLAKYLSTFRLYSVLQKNVCNLLD